MHMQYVALVHWGLGNTTTHTRTSTHTTTHTRTHTSTRPSQVMSTESTERTERTAGAAEGAEQILLWRSYSDNASDSDSDSSTPIYTMSTPGSMFDVDLALVTTNRSNSSIVYVTAGGKASHATTQGGGGDAYAFGVPV